MYPGEFSTNFGDQDLVGGMTLGEYRQGKLPGGLEYFYEATGARTSLEILRGEKQVFEMLAVDQEGTMFGAEQLIGAIYDPKGRLKFAMLLLTDLLYGLSRSGKLVLPDDVVVRVREQLRYGVRWQVMMRLLDESPQIDFNRVDLAPEYFYKLTFNMGVPYPIPGTDWWVGVVKEGDRVGFELGGVNGDRATYWYRSFLNTEDVPTRGGLARLRLPDLVNLVFPEADLKPSQKKTGEEGNGGADEGNNG